MNAATILHSKLPGNPLIAVLHSEFLAGARNEHAVSPKNIHQIRHKNKSVQQTFHLVLYIILTCTGQNNQYAGGKFAGGKFS